MSKQTDTSLFIVSSVPRFYQALLSGIESYTDLGKRIIGEIKTAHAFRQAETVRELAGILMNIPIKEYRLIGQYYLILVQSLALKYPIKELEAIIDQTLTYKAQALLSRGLFGFYKQNTDAALYFYNEALKVRPDISQYIAISLNLAIAKSVEGFHKLALNDLEKLIPIIKYAEPRLYYDFLNSLAVELAEVGRKYEARNVIRHVLESPLIIAYPEWQETGEELKGPNRSFVVIDPSPARMGKLLSMPDPEHAESAIQDRPASVINLQEWVKKMGKDKNGDKDPEIPKDASVADMMIMVMNLMSKEGNADEEKMRKLLEYATKLFSK